jgi:ribosomal protein L17
MRHRVHGRRLNRSSAHRKALRQNLVADLICYEQVLTTEAKARTIQPAAEKMITLAKRGLDKSSERTRQRPFMPVVWLLPVCPRPALSPMRVG